MVKTKGGMVSPRIEERHVREAKQREERLRQVKQRAELRNRGIFRKGVVYISRAKPAENMDEDELFNINVENPKNVAKVEMFNINDGNPDERSDFQKVKDTLRLYNKHFLYFVQEEELRCRKQRVEANGLLKLKSVRPRPDLKTVSKMAQLKEILYPEKRIGHLPGVNVGYQFYSRSEMVAVGIHGHWLSGIDYLSKSIGENKDYKLPIAISIVLSGMYEDDLDKGDEVVYTGQGGQNFHGDKRQVKDQVLEKGNLALKNCIKESVPVRVIRGHMNPSRKYYTYDGLYEVTKCWADKGISGFIVYKFHLRRLEGQQILDTKQVQFIGRRASRPSKILGLVCKDITNGKENFPIPATNLVDDLRVGPTNYTYCNYMKVSKNIMLPMSSYGCNCVGTCEDSESCACAKMNGSSFPYVHHNGDRLIEAKDVIFECGPKCGCGPHCINRTSQKGLQYHLEVFRTPMKGWAVRSWDFIPAGAPICEYTGVLNRADDVENGSENCYIFDIDCLQTMKGLDKRKRRQQNSHVQTILNLSHGDDEESESEPEFCIDAGSIGNISRFINHSCAPNLFVQCVLSSHRDVKLARVVLFAADNIPPMQELTFDYGYVLDSVHGLDGKVKQMLCYCGSNDCRKRLY